MNLKALKQHQYPEFQLDLHWKVVLSLSMLLTSAATIAVKFQLGVLVYVCWFLLGIIAIITRSKTPVLGLVLFGLVLFVGPQAGWLYGRDTHSVARSAAYVYNSGWPIADNLLLSWGATYTPGIHIQVAVSSFVTGLPMLPSTQPRLLISAILPLVFTGVTVSFAYLLAREYMPGAQITDLLAVIFWIPLFYRKTPLRRHSLGTALLMITLYLGYKYYNTNERVHLLGLIGVSAALIITHHLSTVFAIVILSLFLISTRVKSGVYIPIVISAGVAIWYLFLEFGLEQVVRVLTVAIVPTTFGVVNNQIQPTLLSSLRFGLWFIYPGLLAIGIIITVVNKKSKNVPLDDLILPLAAGVIFAPLSIVAWQSGLVAPDRVLTAWILIGAPTAAMAFRQWRSAAYKTVLCALLVISMMMVPLHVVDDSPPKYHDLQDSQRHSQQMYAASEWAEYSTNSIVADGNMYELVSPLSQRRVITSPQTIVDAEVPDGQLVMLRDANSDRYFGPVSGSFVNTDPDDLWKRYGKSSNKIYENGRVRTYE